MEDFSNEAIVLALCCLLLLGVPFDPFAIAPVLGSVTLACLRLGEAPAWARAAAMAAFLACAIAWPAWGLFLPMAAYVGLRERAWALRLAWVAALAVELARWALPAASAVSLAVLCAVAVALAVRQTRAVAERQTLWAASDSLRERLLRKDAVPQAPSGAPGSGPAVASAASGTFDELSERERAITRLVAEGLDNRDIAAELYLSEGTVRNHVSAILQKLELKNRTQLAVLYLTEGA